MRFWSWLADVLVGGWDHNHEMKLVSKTYCPPIPLETGDYLEFSSGEAYERALHGCTTFLWKCQAPSCTRVMTEVVLGQEVA